MVAGSIPAGVAIRVIYLLHVAALLLTYEIAARAHMLDGWVDAPAAWVLALATGAISFRWIELPSQQLGRERAAAYLAERTGRRRTTANEHVICGAQGRSPSMLRNHAAGETNGD